MKNIEETINIFRQKGLKITPQRRAIFELLHENGNHPDAEEIFQDLKIRMPDVSRTTVYNTLKELNKMGIIDTVRNIGEDSVRYDPKTENHDHICCLQCGMLLDIEAENNNVQLSKDKTRGFQVVKQQITFLGYCPDCQKEQRIFHEQSLI